MTTKHFYFDYHYDPRNECYGNNFNERDNYFTRNYDNQQDYGYDYNDYSNFNNRDFNNYGYAKHDFNDRDNDCKKDREERRNHFTCFCRQQDWGWKEDNHECKQKHNHCEHKEKDCYHEQRNNHNCKNRQNNCNCFRCRFKGFFKCW